jgi:hypothetical protein
VGFDEFRDLIVNRFVPEIAFGPGPRRPQQRLDSDPITSTTLGYVPKGRIHETTHRSEMWNEYPCDKLAK